MSRPVLTVEEASQTYESAMRNVLPGGPTVCPTCGTWKPTPYPLCFACNKQPSHLAAVVPITYSEHLRQMHTVLRNYKDGLDEAVRDYAIPRLAAILWRFLDLHEACLAMAADVTAFDLVTTVPSSTPERDDSRGNLRTIVEMCEPIASRYHRVLRATGDAPGRDYHPTRYRCEGDLNGTRILLVDDTWTTGGHAQSAAKALLDAGAERVASVSIGRHVQRDWRGTGMDGPTNHEALAALPSRFDWSVCRVHRDSDLP